MVTVNKAHVRARIEEIGIMPGVRVHSAEYARYAAEALDRAGIPIAEITMTVPGALDVISDLVGKRRSIVLMPVPNSSPAPASSPTSSNLPTRKVSSSFPEL